MEAPGPPGVKGLTGGVIGGGAEPLTGVEDMCHLCGTGASEQSAGHAVPGWITSQHVSLSPPPHTTTTTATNSASWS